MPDSEPKTATLLHSINEAFHSKNSKLVGQLLAQLVNLEPLR
jgi:hypothetical protein